MFAAIAVLFVIVAVAFVIALVEKNQITDPDELLRAQRAWDEEAKRLDGPFAHGMYRMARPLGTSDFVQSVSKNPALNSLHGRVVASGMYGGNIDVFIAYQAAALMFGTAVVFAGAFASVTWFFKLPIIIFGVGMAMMPHDRVRSTAAKKADESATTLPEFVDLLQIPIAAGTGVREALEFTAQHVDSPISVEVRWLLDVLRHNTMTETEAFRQAGGRIGTPEAQSFFTTLGQAYLEGSKVSETLSRQAETLRTRAHQNRRAKIKKIPVKMIVAFAAHFMPLLLVIAMMPLLVSLGSI